MDNLVVFFIIMLATLTVGSIGVAIYVSVEKNKPENKSKSVSQFATGISLILVASVLLGLLIFSVYYAYSKPVPIVNCPQCKTAIWYDQDTETLEAARRTVNHLAEKAKKIPQGLKVSGHCDDPVGGCGLRPPRVVDPQIVSPQNQRYA
jgi:hypothetical protein